MRPDLTRSLWRLLAAPMCMALVLLSPATAMAQTYGPGTTPFAVSTSVVPAGGLVAITVIGFIPGETVTITFESVPVVVGTAVADANGVVSLTVRIPSNATPGIHHLVATGSQSGRVVSTTITVVAPTLVATPDPPGIAFTGTNALMGTGVGAAIIGGGGLLVLLTRKRRHRGVEA